MKSKYDEDEDGVKLTPKLLQPYGRKKPKIKYETLDDVDSEIRMFTGMRSQIEINHEDGKGNAYAVLSQLCPKSWRNYALIRKPNQLSYYRNHLRLQVYVKEICNKVSNQYGNLCKEGDNWISERGLTLIPRIYKKLLIVFHTCNKLIYIFQIHKFLVLVLILVVIMIL
jgi:hypothetical protein